MSFEEKFREHRERLRSLHNKRQEARNENHQEVIIESARLKLPKNWEVRKLQADWLLADEKARKEAMVKGKDYDRHKLLHISAIDAGKIEKRKNNKNPDLGFSSYEAQTARQYNRLVKKITGVNAEKYEKQKCKLQNFLYVEPKAMVRIKDTTVAIDNMVNDLNQQIDKRKKYSRRRIYNDDADVDFINERNSNFNKKLTRFYGEHTLEIKHNLERGTAI